MNKRIFLSYIFFLLGVSGFPQLKLDNFGGNVFSTKQENTEYGIKFDYMNIDTLSKTIYLYSSAQIIDKMELLNKNNLYSFGKYKIEGTSISFYHTYFIMAYYSKVKSSNSRVNLNVTTKLVKHKYKSKYVIGNNGDNLSCTIITKNYRLNRTDTTQKYFYPILIND